MSVQAAFPLRTPKIAALCGGVGGAKLALGLSRLPGTSLTVIVNTGDDFEHLGLHISPDIDTVVYTLGGLADAERGWGRADESWNFMESIGQLGGETWFRLGDRDLAMHIERTRALRHGTSLTDFTNGTAKRLGIAATVLPMTNHCVETVIFTDEGELSFQKYFVGLKCAPAISRITFQGADRAAPSDQVLSALKDPELAAVIICPSNPYLSIDPILALAEIRKTLCDVSAPIIAVSPLIGGRAVKGPTAKIMAELGVPLTDAAIAQHYGFIDGLIVDGTGLDESCRLEIPVHRTATLMHDLEDRDRLARESLKFASRLAATAEGTADHTLWRRRRFFAGALP